MNILSIGFDIPGYGDNYKDFKSQTSLLDGDIIFFSPSINYGFSGQTHEGKAKYGEADSYKVKRDSIHWQNEIDSALANGKTIIFILSPLDSFIVDSGKKDINGTGRNSRIINYVEDWNNYNCVSLKGLIFRPTNGLKIKCSNPIFSEFYSQFGDMLSFKIYIESKEIKQAFTTLNGEKTLGGILKVGTGNIIFIPHFDFSHKDFIKKLKDTEIWTPAAIKKGKVLVNMFIKIAKAINSDLDKTPPPDWVSGEEYRLSKETKLISELDLNIESIKGIQNKIDSLKKELDEVNSLKDLLFASGKQLENAVIKALIILGYQTENYNDGKLEIDQIIVSPEGERFIGECEGKDTKDIDISKFRQLMDSLNEDFARDEVDTRAMGILFGNPQRLIKPSERTLDFTLKCKNGAEREKIALIKTSDLYVITKYLLENKDLRYQKRCRDSILAQLGKEIKFPDIPQKNKQPLTKTL